VRRVAVETGIEEIRGWKKEVDSGKGGCRIGGLGGAEGSDEKLREIRSLTSCSDNLCGDFEGRLGIQEIGRVFSKERPVEQGTA
jgi:hypothetical protein